MIHLTLLQKRGDPAYNVRTRSSMDGSTTVMSRTCARRITSGEHPGQAGRPNQPQVGKEHVEPLYRARYLALPDWLTSTSRWHLRPSRSDSAANRFRDLDTGPEDCAG
jgi:hypothetical protein